MREEQYRAICHACDRVLMAPGLGLARVAIPWLHVIREHPVVLAQYAGIVQPDGGGSGRLTRSIRSSLTWGRGMWRAASSDGEHWVGRDLPQGVDVLIVSHLVSRAHVGAPTDFYFSGLPQELERMGRSVLIALINHTGTPAQELEGEWDTNLAPRVVLSSTLGLTAERALRRDLRREARALNVQAAAEPDPMMRRVLRRAAAEALSSGSQGNLRLARQIGALVRALNPTSLMVTYEGHAWERVAFASARAERPAVRCVGYQHSALFPLQHAIRRNLGPSYDPDRLLTSGTASKRSLESSPDLARTPIAVLGSNRGAKLELGESPSNEEIGARAKACLVLPEGFASECHRLFGFSLECARAFPEIEFIWRLHPVLSFSTLAAGTPDYKRLPRNVSLSVGTLEEAVSLSRWVLYRGSTAVVKAVMAGVRPIYLTSDNEMSIDPLAGIGDWRGSVQTPAEFGWMTTGEPKSGMEACEGMPSVSPEEEAREYCASLFTPFDFDLLSSV